MTAAQRKAVNRKWINEYKQSTPCADCEGYFEPVQMDFDHLPGQEKSFSIALGTDRSRRALEQEIEKCELVCANCHRLRTHKRRQSTGVDAA